MGSSVWQFMWLIDKVTRIDEDGWGWILGGKPINLKDIAIGVTENTVSRNLHRLQKEGYIQIKHTPYGLILKVKKAKKRFSRSVEPTLTKKVNHIIKKGEPNKTVSIDNNSKTSNERDLKKENFVFKDYLEELSGHKVRIKRIIASFWVWVHLRFETKEQANGRLGRDLFWAKKLEVYSDDKIDKVMDWLDENADFKWELSTVLKYIDRDLNKITIKNYAKN